MGELTWEEVSAQRDEVRKKMAAIVDASAALLAPLKGLTDEQRVAVVALGLMTRVITLAQRRDVRLDPALIERFGKEIDQYCPPLGAVAMSRTGDPCQDASLAYAQAITDCAKHGVDEQHCYKAYNSFGQMATCVLREVEGMRRVLGDLFNGLKPPRPFPFPI